MFDKTNQDLREAPKAELQGEYSEDAYLGNYAGKAYASSIPSPNNPSDISQDWFQKIKTDLHKSWEKSTFNDVLSLNKNNLDMTFDDSGLTSPQGGIHSSINSALDDIFPAQITSFFQNPNELIVSPNRKKEKIADKKPKEKINKTRVVIKNKTRKPKPKRQNTKIKVVVHEKEMDQIEVQKMIAQEHHVDENYQLELNQRQLKLPLDASTAQEAEQQINLQKKEFNLETMSLSGESNEESLEFMAYSNQKLSSSINTLVSQYFANKGEEDNVTLNDYQVKQGTEGQNPS